VADLVVIVPSRGRPENIARLADAWTTRRIVSTQLVVAVDEDDPRLEEYRAVELPFLGALWVGQRRRMCGTLNAVALDLLEDHADSLTGWQPDVIGFMGDDHLPRTEGWDVDVVDALDDLGGGIVYGNDLLQGEKLPTAVFMTAGIVRTLGWMVPPGLIHLYADNVWLELGSAMGRLRYLPGTVIEHLHPAAGKAVRDAGYAEANAPEIDAADKAVFEAWVRDGLPGAVQHLRTAGLC
jgi:hypothetical protein